MKGLAKELQPLAREYQAKGWALELTGSGHVRWKGPRGELVISACTPSDWRAKKHLKARLRRAERTKR
jgi:hypothetical protein